MNEPLTSRELSEELYILTNCGHKLETQYYYDQFGHVWSRAMVASKTVRTLPKEFTPAYSLGYMRHLAATKLKNLERHKSKLKTALLLGEDATAEFLIQMGKQNQIKK